MKLRQKQKDALLGKGSFGKVSETNLEKQTKILVDLVKSVRMNNFRIEQLVQELYT